ncbi:hypothetical protein V8C86DRAFT_1017561 [Haematococcus lacustris]
MDAMRLGQQVGQQRYACILPCHVTTSTSSSRPAVVQELAALDKAVHQAKSAATRTTSAGTATGHGQSSLDGEVTSRMTATPTCQPHAAEPTLLIPSMDTAADVTPVGTPWTVNNAALPAYPAQFTPQMPFKPLQPSSEEAPGRSIPRRSSYTAASELPAPAALSRQSSAAAGARPPTGPLRTTSGRAAAAELAQRRSTADPPADPASQEQQQRSEQPLTVAQRRSLYQRQLGFGSSSSSSSSEDGGGSVSSAGSGHCSRGSHAERAASSRLPTFAHSHGALPNGSLPRASRPQLQGPAASSSHSHGRGQGYGAEQEQQTPTSHPTRPQPISTQPLPPLGAGSSYPTASLPTPPAQEPDAALAAAIAADAAAPAQEGPLSLYPDFSLVDQRRKWQRIHTWAQQDSSAAAGPSPSPSVPGPAPAPTASHLAPHARMHVDHTEHAAHGGVTSRGGAAGQQGWGGWQGGVPGGSEGGCDDADALSLDSTLVELEMQRARASLQAGQLNRAAAAALASAAEVSSDAAQRRSGSTAWDVVGHAAGRAQGHELEGMAGAAPRQGVVAHKPRQTAKAAQPTLLAQPAQLPPSPPSSQAGGDSRQGCGLQPRFAQGQGQWPDCSQLSHPGGVQHKADAWDDDGIMSLLAQHLPAAGPGPSTSVQPSSKAGQGTTGSVVDLTRGMSRRSSRQQQQQQQSDEGGRVGSSRIPAPPPQRMQSAAVQEAEGQPPAAPQGSLAVAPGQSSSQGERYRGGGNKPLAALAAEVGAGWSASGAG